MIIRDKQTLRRCVKQAVRRAAVVEAELRFDIKNGGIGVDAGILRGRGTPFSQDAAALYAALGAAGLPTHDLRRAQQEIDVYERDAYLREMLDAMSAALAYVRVPQDAVREVYFGDDRLVPLPAVDACAFPVERYGVNYESAVRRIDEGMRALGARDLLWEGPLDLDVMRFALLPLCEDEGYRLHVTLASECDVKRLGEAHARFPVVRLLARADECDVQRALIELSAQEPHVTVCLTSPDDLRFALEKLGTRFVAYSSRSQSMELAAGRWLLFKERLHPLLTEAYLPLARSGYELTDEAVAEDVQRMLGGCLTE